MANKYIMQGVNYGRNLNDYIPGAPSFQYWEFVSSETAIRHSVKNVPNEEQWKAIELLCVKILQPVRNHFGPIKINSGFRNPILSALVGSSTSSNHTRGEAADFESYDENISLMTVLKYIQENLVYHEMIAEFFPDGWVHVAYREGSKAKNLKLKDNAHNFSKVTLSYIEGIYKY